MHSISLSLLFAACSIAAPKPVNNPNPVAETTHAVAQDHETAYFASGCFWCVEAVFEQVEGVKEVISGYSGGETINPTYRQVISGNTGHAESIKVIYNPKVVLFKTLVQVFFGSHDPTTLNRQGPDKGTQYRSVAFYQSDGEKKTIESTIEKLTLAKRFKNPIVTEVKKFEAFYQAEDYHQDFEASNPNHPYIKAISKPRVSRFLQAYPELVKAGLE